MKEEKKKKANVKEKTYDEWLITCELCDYQWEVNFKEETVEPECPRCGFEKCSIFKIDPEIVKRRGEIIGFVECDPITGKFGYCYEKTKDGEFLRLEKKKG